MKYAPSSSSTALKLPCNRTLKKVGDEGGQQLNKVLSVVVNRLPPMFSFTTLPWPCCWWYFIAAAIAAVAVAVAVVAVISEAVEEQKKGVVLPPSSVAVVVVV